MSINTQPIFYSLVKTGNDVFVCFMCEFFLKGRITVYFMSGDLANG